MKRLAKPSNGCPNRDRRSASAPKQVRLPAHQGRPKSIAGQCRRACRRGASPPCPWSKRESCPILGNGNRCAARRILRVAADPPCPNPQSCYLPRRAPLARRKHPNERTCRPGIPGHPRPDNGPRRGPAGHASPRRGHLFRRAAGPDRQPDARRRPRVQHKGPRLHLHRQRPRRLGSRPQQRAQQGRQDPDPRKRPVRRKLGQQRRPHGPRGGGTEGRHAPRRPPGRGRGTPQGRQGRHHQGCAGRAGRHRLGRGERHRRHRPGDPCRRPRRAADGGCRRVTRLHAVRHG